MDRPVFVPPSEEGARIALPARFRDKGAIEVLRRCAVVIDVYDHEGTLLQRAIAHDDVPTDVRRALTELVDHYVTRFADAQLLESVPRGTGSPYRGGAVQRNDFAGFDCAFAARNARDRVGRVRDSLRSGADLEVRMYAVPFLYFEQHGDGDVVRAVIIRAEDGTYCDEAIEGS